MSVKVKQPAMTSVDATQVSILDLPIADWVRIFMWDGGYRTLQDVFELLVKYEGDLSKIKLSIDGRELHPYTPAVSDTIEQLLAKHPATKAAFEEKFEIVQPHASSNGQTQTTLRQFFNASLDRPLKDLLRF
jgi:hypothetical protein